MLYHIRLYKKPAVAQDTISGTFTIVNDLGDLFYYGSATVQVSDGQGNTTKVNWSPGMRSAKFCLNLGGFRRRQNGVQISIVVNRDKSNQDMLYSESEPHFLSVEYNSAIGEDLVLRRLDGGLVIAEELGSNNLARHVWDAGIAACRYLQTSEINEQPSNILELGSGCGLVGICLAKRFRQSKVVLTDLDDAREMCQTNIQLNNVGATAQFEQLDWDDQTACSNLAQRCVWDLILVTDCTYNPSSYEILLTTIQTLATPNKTQVLVAHKFRDESETEFFDLFPYALQLDTQLDLYNQSVKLIIGK